MAVQVLRVNGLVVIYSGPSALPMAQEDNRTAFSNKGVITTGFEVTTKGEFYTAFATVEEAIAHVDLLPVEAEAQVWGWCSDHGRTDYGDGFCYTCMEEYYDHA